MFIDEREGGRRIEGESERDTDVKEKHLSVASCMTPDWGPSLQPPLGARDNAPTNRATQPGP